MRVLFIFLVFSSVAHSEALMFPELQPFLDTFRAELDRYGSEEMKTQYFTKISSIVVDKGAAPIHADGVCERGKAGRRITLDSERWGRETQMEREIVLFHELGHCIFDFEHDNRHYLDGRPYSIMHPAGPSERQYREQRDVYLYQFFHEEWVERREP